MSEIKYYFELAFGGVRYVPRSTFCLLRHAFCFKAHAVGHLSRTFFDVAYSNPVSQYTGATPKISPAVIHNFRG